MGISTVEFKKEEKILAKVSELLSETIDEVGKDVYHDEDNLVEFKKMMWQDASSFDQAEFGQVMAATSQEA